MENRLSLPLNVRLFEVAPRDGLQNEPQILNIDEKATFISSLIETGITDIEIGSFVSPKWVPQMANTKELFNILPKNNDIRYWALVPNKKGLETALECGISNIAVFMSSSEEHNHKNLNKSIKESISELEEIIKFATNRNITVRAYLSTVFGCPYEGNVDLKKVLTLSKQLLDAGAFQISLGDTIGIATPNQIYDLAHLISKYESINASYALHLHDTRGCAIANIFYALQLGFTVFDTALGGIGGCPYASGASGNVATEDTLYLLNGLSVETGISLDKCVKSSKVLSNILNKALPSKYYKYATGKNL